MKIAFVHQPWDDANPVVKEGSLAIWTDEVGRRLAEDHEVLVFGRHNPARQWVEERDGIRYFGVRLSHDRPLLKLMRLFSSKSNPKRPEFSRGAFHYMYAMKIARAARRERCDVIHIHNFSNFAPVIRRFNPNARIILHMHCEWLSQLDPKLIEPRLRKVDAIVACSDYVTERVRKAFPQHAGKCHTVPNGVDAGRFSATGNESPRNGACRVLFVGRVSPEKGVHTLIDGFERVVREQPGCSLRIVGPLTPAPREFIAQVCDAAQAEALAPCYERDYIADLREKAARAGGTIDISGPTPHGEMPTLYADADVLVNPSVSEAFGMSLIEAMASGTPVVATRVGGMTEILAEQEAGLLVEPNDPDALSDAILRLARDPDLRRTMGMNGREIARNRYTWDHTTDALRRIYQLAG